MIGTLNEKTLHRQIKSRIEPDVSCHEIKVGSFIADIYTGGRIIEVQTRGLWHLERKLNEFLKFAPVTLVHPVALNTRLIWLDPKTGEVREERLSPKHGSIFSSAVELIRLKKYLKEPRLDFLIILVNIKELRLLDGYGKSKKSRASRLDKIPTEFLDEIYLREPEDFDVFLPKTLEGEFTSRDYGREAAASPRVSQSAINLLYTMGRIKECGRDGRFTLWRRVGNWR